MLCIEIGILVNKKKKADCGCFLLNNYKSIFWWTVQIDCSPKYTKKV